MTFLILSPAKQAAVGLNLLWAAQNATVNTPPCFSFTEYNPYLDPCPYSWTENYEKFLRNCRKEIYCLKFLFHFGFR